MFELRQTPVFSRWFTGLKDRKALRIIAKRLTLIEAGHMGDVKPVGAGVSEIRVHFGPWYRVYFTRRGKTVILLLCGGDKGTQTRDIRRAQDMVKEIGDGNDEV